MSTATFIGLVAAILLISSLIFGALDVLVPKSAAITVCGIASALSGFLMVIIAALIVIVEGGAVKSQLDDEMRDVSSLADEVAGRI